MIPAERPPVCELNSAQRFSRFLSFSPALDRLPVIEWASWWDETLEAWYRQGLPRGLDIANGINAYFGQDGLHQYGIAIRDEGCPVPTDFGAPIIHNEQEYEAVRPFLYTDRLLASAADLLREFHREHGKEGYALWYTLEGFFWFPRVMLGIENHFYAFYDQPELIHRLNRDLCDYYKRGLDVLYDATQPQFMTFAEDMSYNHGPMLSRELYNEFILPYYQELTPLIHARGTKVIVDTDGFVEPMIPWLLDGGIDGVLPLERMAGVDVNRIRAQYPDFLMIGGFDKTVMHKGETAMRAEFERLLPAIRSGGYLPSVDHQTPPDVDIPTYRVYMRLLNEYCRKIHG